VTMSTPLPGMGSTISKDSRPAKVVIPTISSVSVTMTARAAEKAKTVLASKGVPEGMLRVFVVGGGCSGYQYGMAIAPEAEADDEVVITEHGVNIVLDRESVPMIAGAEIDYVEDLMKAGFTIYNPNATSSCACGSSFQSSDGSGTPRACS
jgi:iron-sulfur cluster assembly protein